MCRILPCETEDRVCLLLAVLVFLEVWQSILGSSTLSKKTETILGDYVSLDSHIF